LGSAAIRADYAEEGAFFGRKCHTGKDCNYRLTELNIDDGVGVNRREPEKKVSTKKAKPKNKHHQFSIKILPSLKTQKT